MPAEFCLLESGCDCPWSYRNLFAWVFYYLISFKSPSHNRPLTFLSVPHSISVGNFEVWSSELWSFYPLSHPDSLPLHCQRLVSLHPCFLYRSNFLDLQTPSQFVLSLKSIIALFPFKSWILVFPVWASIFFNYSLTWFIVRHWYLSFYGHSSLWVYSSQTEKETRVDMKAWCCTPQVHPKFQHQPDQEPCYSEKGIMLYGP